MVRADVTEAYLSKLTEADRQGLGAPDAAARRRHTPSQAALRLKNVFAVDDATGSLRAVWQVKEQLRALLRGGSLEDDAAPKTQLEELVKAAARPETNRPHHNCLQVVERHRGAHHYREHRDKNIRRPTRDYPNAGNSNRLFSREVPSGRRQALTPGIPFHTNRQEPLGMPAHPGLSRTEGPGGRQTYSSPKTSGSAEESAFRDRR